jgi:hypothetical protein
MDPARGIDREGRVVTPDFIVNIESSFPRKQRMLAQHRSQREWLAAHHGIDNYLEEMENRSRQRGALAGIEFGEGFRHYKGYTYPESSLLEDALGSQLVLPVSV